MSSDKKKQEIPNPGSDEAIALGCTCAVMDNGHGKGSGWKTKEGEPMFWITAGCPIHGEKANE